MNEKVEKKIKVQATNEMNYYRFVQFKGLDIHQYRALKEGQIIEITKAVFEFNKHLLKEVK